MSLNIKSDEAHQLARELAALTGESMTEAVTISVRERLERERRERDHRTAVAEILRLGREIAARTPPDAMRVEDFYDERGMPV